MQVNIKTGGTSGCKSKLEFNPKTGDVDILMINQENLTSQKEKLAEQEKDSKTVSEDNWVKKLDLQKSEEKEKSFVEKMRSGKDGGKSRDGYNEL